MHGLSNTWSTLFLFKYHVTSFSIGGFFFFFMSKIVTSSVMVVQHQPSQVLKMWQTSQTSQWTQHGGLWRCSGDISNLGIYADYISSFQNQNLCWNYCWSNTWFSRLPREDNNKGPGTWLMQHPATRQNYIMNVVSGTMSPPREWIWKVTWTLPWHNLYSSAEIMSKSNLMSRILQIKSQWWNMFRLLTSWLQHFVRATSFFGSLFKNLKYVDIKDYRLIAARRCNA